MRKDIKTYGIPVAINLNVHSDSLQEVEVFAKHPSFHNTCFTQRILQFKGDKFVKILLPVSPKEGVTIVARNYHTKKEGGISVKNCELAHLDTKIHALPKNNKYLWEFINHGIDFCLRASFLPQGYYNSKNIKIYYTNFLKNKDENGNIINTSSPARVNSDTKIIEMSRNFFKYRTVAERFAVLCHEFAHVYMNNVASSEIEADRNAAMIYLGLGFSRVDLINIWADIYKAYDSKENRKRIDNYMMYIKQYDKI